MKGLLSLFVVLAIFPLSILGQSLQKVAANNILIKDATNASWWAGIIEHGFQMPLADGYAANVCGENYENQVQPLLLSDQGDVIWSEDPFTIRVQQGNLLVGSEGDPIRIKAGNSLREAFLYASKTYFPPSGKTPDELLFSSPQYNTWIELMYNQNQADILKYAKGIKDHGFPAGVLMIDDNWQEDYGKWDFKKGRFPDPKTMIATLHAEGFKVMLWVCPFISPDCDVYRDLEKKNLLVKDDSSQPAIVRWWNGASALLDFTNPKSVEWFRSQLDYLQSTYHIDGFKFDGGDSSFYRGVGTLKPESPNMQTALYGKIGLNYPLNEYRAMWKMGGQPLGERLSDKAHSWTDLQKLIPDMILEGLMGYPFSCPDMIGGGEFISFLPGSSTIDQELIVRSAQCQALMPMMQFSVAPWRVLDKKRLKAVLEAVKVREEHKDYILKLVKHAALTGEPIVRSMEYVFPHQGYAHVNDQYMLGNQILVAPVLENESSKREVILPAGSWKGFNGKLYQGPAKFSITVRYDELCYFENAD
ncbi:MAG TPA: glycoside hydrolase family 31 protein [Verrucomicrobiae bacterium]|nr:glycoside hydrolase family 31 protein [Verrucomicrobiae bacterium]